MKGLNEKEINEEILKQDILEGKIFIYPTDTIYGIGCNALDKKAVEKIKNIKARDKDKPLSIIAPSIDWIKENLIVPTDFDLKKYLPGAYTIILKKKNPGFLKLVSSGNSLGIRIPDCDFTKIIQKSGVPFITTSVNLSGEPFALRLNDLKQEIKKQVDVIIKSENEDKMIGKPSTLIINGKEMER
ncbi:MAG TPA: L-threonylcarbamoyladenylate synthase [Candidatus Paceibacterota bacterium]|nr:L-threonylcarbamoyladenylate synthase [Candidatus Paceibacterota bacterium]